jgi:hypothetical protein
MIVPALPEFMATHPELELEPIYRGPARSVQRRRGRRFLLLKNVVALPVRLQEFKRGGV